jgi:hypothetical protein
MGPGASGNPFVRSVTVRRGWLKIGIRRELAEYPQRLHLIAIHPDEGPQTIHESIGLDTDEKTVTVQFEPTTDTKLVFQPAVPLAESTPDETAYLLEGALPTQIAFRLVNAERTSQEFDAVTATLDAQGGSPSITDLTDGIQIETGDGR